MSAATVLPLRPPPRWRTWPVPRRRRAVGALTVVAIAKVLDRDGYLTDPTGAELAALQRTLTGYVLEHRGRLPHHDEGSRRRRRAWGAS